VGRGDQPAALGMGEDRDHFYLQPRSFWFFLQQWEKEQNRSEVENFGQHSLKRYRSNTSSPLPQFSGIV
jgi:hypothetical protein